MCLIAFNWQPDDAVPLVVAANRDEFHARPTLPLHRWRDHAVLAGRDRESGGTWLGVTPNGRFAAVTNFRLPGAPAAPRSRGELPVGFLAGDQSPQAYAQAAWSRRGEYRPFSLLICDRQSLWFVSSHGAGPESVAPGVHALSNHLLDTPWPKVTRIRRRLREATETGNDIGVLLDLLLDTQPADETDLLDTGVERETERLLSAPFVKGDEYGTRSSTVLILGSRTRIAERSYGPQAQVRGEITCEFSL